MVSKFLRDLGLPGLNVDRLARFSFSESGSAPFKNSFLLSERSLSDFFHLNDRPREYMISSGSTGALANPSRIAGVSFCPRFATKL